MEKTYEPKKYENKIYKSWLHSGFFCPEKSLSQKKTFYSVVLPPPNITNKLHMGHALNATIQDILVRYHRMKGEKTLWLPGTDHAGIATQNVVEKELKKEGLTRHQLGREEFVKRVWQWVEKYKSLILEQLKKMGCSCDWSRERFTLDKNYAKAVYTAFLYYYKKGLIYRGPRIVNWCPRCETAISDIEVKYQEAKGKLWYIKYPLKNPKPQIPNFVTVATTRPETMLGDTAVAVNPKDERYKNLVGQKVFLPIMNREIPIITHHLVDPSFGTGVVKITPAHDATDWQIGKEKKLEVINIIGPDGKMTKNAGKFAGLTTLEAREKILEELKNQNLLEKEEDYAHNLALCERCQTPIEPQISTQWFLKMKDLARPAIDVVKKGKIKIIPERYKKIYLNWLAKIEDWCISRQLWWGHQLPVFFCQKEQGKIQNSQSQTQNFVVTLKKPKKCPICHQCEMKQSEDVLDTWFSSALWPFAVFNWPKKTKDLKNFYPTNFLSTAQEILYLWVARMIFSSLEFTKKIPFKEVYIHPTVLAITGRRMSKSLGTGIDPLEIAEKYGADAVRMGLIYQTTRDQQAFKFDERAILSARNFINKLWNISRFIEMSTKQIPNPKPQTSNKFKTQNPKSKTLADRWILSRLNTIIELTTQKIKNYQFGEAIRELYDFVWHDFADWYIEIAKHEIRNPLWQSNSAERQSKTNIINILYNSLLVILKLLHPFIPFVTETIYQQLFGQHQPAFLIVAEWPKPNKKLINKKAEDEFEKIKELIIEIRNWKAKEKIPFPEIKEYQIEVPKKFILTNREIIEKLTRTKLILKGTK